MRPRQVLNDTRNATIAAVILLAAVFVLRLTVGKPGDGILFLAIIPIAILATEYRVAGGLVGAGLAAVMTVVWANVEGGFRLTAILTRILTFLVVGIGVGVATKARGERDERLHDLRDLKERHDAALKIHDEIVQGLTVAKMALELNDLDRALKALDAALENAQAVVASGVLADRGSLRSPGSPRPHAP